MRDDRRYDMPDNDRSKLDIPDRVGAYRNVVGDEILRMEKVPPRSKRVREFRYEELAFTDEEIDVMREVIGDRDGDERESEREQKLVETLCAFRQ